MRLYHYLKAMWYLFLANFKSDMEKSDLLYKAQQEYEKSKGE